MRQTVQNLRGPNPHENYFRRAIHLATRPRRAVLRIYADTTYELFVNGRLAAALSEWANARDYLLTPFFQQGDNLIAIRASNASGHRGLACELVADGTSVLVTDATWRCFPEERWGWLLPDFDDRNWLPPTVLDLSAAGGPQWTSLPGCDPDRIIPTLEGSPFFTGPIPKGIDSPLFTARTPNWSPSPDVLDLCGQPYQTYVSTPFPSLIRATRLLLPQPQGGLRSADVQDPLTLTAPDRYTGPSLIIDLGQEAVGHLRLRVRSDAPVSFRLYHAETLTEALHEIGRDQVQNRMLREEYRLEAGNQEFEQRMRFGGRFIRLELFDSPQPVTLSDFALRTTAYPLAPQGFFHCSDELLNRLWLMGQRTLHWCMQEYILDAPKRDRFQWVGDTWAQHRYAACLSTDTTLFQFCWDEMAKVQYPNGAIPSAFGHGLSVIWDYVAMYIIAFRDHYLNSGDDALIRRHTDTIRKATDFLVSKADADGLISVPQNPLGKLWMVVLNQAVGKDTFLNRLYADALDAASLACRLAEDHAGATRYATLATQTRSALAALPPLTDTPTNWHSSLMLYAIVEEAIEHGHHDQALELLRTHWGKLAQNGADTFAEGFFSNIFTSITDLHDETPSYVSYCHGWTAAPVHFLARHLAGIRPLEPGYARFQVQPHPADLTHFQCVIPTPHGEIALAYTRADGFTLIVPTGTSADVLLPSGQRLTLGAGRHHLA